MKTLLSPLFDKFKPPKMRVARTKVKLGKRDAVIFGAILLDLKGLRYCHFLHEHHVKPKWCDSDPDADSYPKSYNAGGAWRKKVQDEKTRAKLRMDRYKISELVTSFQAYLRDQYDALRQRLSMRCG